MTDEILRYREAAALCVGLAETTRDPNTRIELLELARIWQRFADDHFALRRVATSAEGLIGPGPKTRKV